MVLLRAEEIVEGCGRSKCVKTRTGDKNELKERASGRGDAIPEESGNDRKNRSWQKGRLLTRGVGGKGLWFLQRREKLGEKKQITEDGKTSSRLDWAEG